MALTGGGYAKVAVQSGDKLMIKARIDSQCDAKGWTFDGEWLYLMMNDINGSFVDNGGSIRVVVQTMR